MKVAVTYVRPPLVSPTPPADREKVCATCAKCVDGVCQSKLCGCPANRKRIHPWLTLTKCPEGKW